MSINDRNEWQDNSVQKESAKLELKKQEVISATRALALKRNVLLDAKCPSASCTMKKRSTAINEAVKELKQLNSTHIVSSEIEEGQLAIAEKEFQLTGTAYKESEVKLSANRRRLLINGYTYQIPVNSLQNYFNSSAPCEGCGQLFPCHVFPRSKEVVHDISYFLHTFSCRQFMSLDLIKYCHECKFVFRSTSQLGCHRNKHHETSKPTWMTSVSYKNSVCGGKSSEISCPGCKMKFMAKRSNRHIQPELAYYMHCIEQCPEYKKLNLIGKCNECDKLFISRRALGNHMGKVHDSIDDKLFLKKRARGNHISVKHAGDVAREPVRSWMPLYIRKHKRYNWTYNSSKECEGCGEKFPCWKSRAGKTWLTHRSYYIHCVEECEPYRALGKIFTCAKCKCKFLNNRHCCS